MQGSDVVRSYFRNYFKVFLAGIPLLFQKELEEDGSPVCRLAMEQDINIRQPKNLDELAAETVPADSQPD